MGLISQILTFPLAPARGAAWVLDQVVLAAERDYYDPELVRAQLAELEQELTSGAIDEDEFDRREDELLDRLEVFEAQQERLKNNS